MKSTSFENIPRASRFRRAQYFVKPLFHLLDYFQEKSLGDGNVWNCLPTFDRKKHNISTV